MAYSRWALERRKGEAYGSSGHANQRSHEMRNENEQRFIPANPNRPKMSRAMEAQTPAAKAFYSLGGYDRAKLSQDFHESKEYAGIQKLLAMEAAKNNLHRKEPSSPPPEEVDDVPSRGLKLTEAMEEEQENHRLTYGTDGTLKPNSVGSNVKVFWKSMEIERIHYAALHVPWSYVGVLRDVAANGVQEGGYLLVNLDEILDDEGQQLFPEDFNTYFEAVFREHFVPLVHEQFNLKGARPKSLPDDIADCYKLLVIAERLSAKLMEIVFLHMIRTVEGCNMNDTPRQGTAYKLIRVCLEFTNEPPPATCQHKIVQKAIQCLVSQIPRSLPALEDLIRESAEKQRADMAVWLFRHANAHYTDVAKANEEMIWDNTQNYVGELKSQLQETKSNKDAHMLANFVNSYEHRSTPSLPDRVAQAGAGFSQGMILEKMVQGLSTGLRIVRCCGNFLLWKKPWKAAFNVPYKHIKRENIVTVELEEGDVHHRTLRIVTNRHPIYLSFRAADTETCLSCIGALRQWLGRVVVENRPEEQHSRQLQAEAGPPPPPPRIPDKPEHLKNVEFDERQEIEHAMERQSGRLQTMIPPPPPVAPKVRRGKMRSSLL